MTRDVIGSIGALLAVIAAVTYLHSIMTGTTRPHTVSWGVWCVLGITGAWVATRSGAGSAVIVLWCFAAAQTVIFLLSLRSRYTKPGVLPGDIVVGLIAGGILVLWGGGMLRNATAMAGVVVADAIALWPTLREAWRAPGYEALTPWVLGSIAFVCSVAAVDQHTILAFAYPAYLAATNVLIVVILAVRRGRGVRRAGEGAGATQKQV